MLRKKMGAGASAADGRIFCHSCGARTAAVLGVDSPCCGVCGATEDVEVTDARLPVTSPSSRGTVAQGITLLGAGRGVGAREQLRLRNSPGRQVESSSRVESVTVVAVQRPEDGGLLLRVLPNVVTRREMQAPVSPPVSTAIAETEEEWEVPPEPACDALVSRLQAQPLQKGVSAFSHCVICAEEIGEVGTPVVALACEHTFHEECIRRWLTKRHTCPTCRLELEVDDVRYLRSIGLMSEADALEKVEQEKNAAERHKQAVARRRWVESMRRGDPVHFGLACAKCGLTPLTGECFRCLDCEGYILCQKCNAERASCFASQPPGPLGRVERGVRVVGNARSRRPDRVPDATAPWRPSPRSDGLNATRIQDCWHPASHHFELFEPGGTGTNFAGSGMLTVLVPSPARLPLLTAGRGVAGGDAETSLAAAEVAYAAVRSLALAPLATSSPLVSPRLGSLGAHGQRWVNHGRSRVY